MLSIYSPNNVLCLLCAVNKSVNRGKISSALVKLHPLAMLAYNEGQGYISRDKRIFMYKIIDLVYVTVKQCHLIGLEAPQAISKTLCVWEGHEGMTLSVIYGL